MKIGSVSMHKFSSEDDFGTHSAGFTPAEYSRFKYGSKSVARQYGSDLAEHFFREFIFGGLGAGYADKQIVVISSPYDFIPTATFAMKDYFVARLNEKLIHYHINPVQELKVHRTRSYNDDYGLMTAEERHALISADKFHIDREFVKDKLVIFMDDVKITGGHERVIQKMIDENQLECDYVFLYFAELVNPDTHPKIENFLNHAFVKNILDVNSIIRDDEFLFNTRVVKYILSAPEFEFCNFINYQSEVFKKTLMDNAIGNSYYKKPEYIVNFNHLKNKTYDQYLL